MRPHEAPSAPSHGLGAAEHLLQASPPKCVVGSSVTDLARNSLVQSATKYLSIQQIEYCHCTVLKHPDAAINNLLSLIKDLGGPLREYREFLEGALWQFLAGLLGLRLGPWGRTDGIKWWGKAVAFNCLHRLTGFILSELC